MGALFLCRSRSRQWNLYNVDGHFKGDCHCILIKATQLFNMALFSNMKFFVEHREGKL